MHSVGTVRTTSEFRQTD
uniref:Uncharacterized protein n=1 Tax=Rhizophora mucronata TaxID=61149 RepID=A0A2P2R349_RHIMU